MTNNEKYALWNRFLERWPLEKLQSMTYEEYSGGGNKDTFCYWLEHKTEALGSIRGGSSAKFGVYVRASQNPGKQSGCSYSDTDVWYTKYGNTAAEAFIHVRSLIVKIVNAARDKHWEEIDAIDLGSMVKWKVAFLYQSQDDIRVVNLFSRNKIATHLGESDNEPFPVLFAKLLESEKGVNVFDLAANVLEGDAAEQVALEAPASSSKNIILYGPPGTGKTYALKNGLIPGLERLKDIPEEQKRFVTFHPSYSYEDFIEGIIPVLDGGISAENKLNYRIKQGVLQEIALKASQDCTGASLNNEATIWKMSLGRAGVPEDELIYKACMEKGYALYGYVDADLTSYMQNSEELLSFVKEENGEKGGVPRMTRKFVIEMKIGDTILVTKGNKAGVRAVGIVRGNYEYMPIRESKGKIYPHGRKVEWIWHNNDVPIPVKEIVNDSGIVQPTIYNITRNINREALAKALSERMQKRDTSYILNIDEINRGNTAKIFGELITLLEEDKRWQFDPRGGEQRGMEVILPSGDKFRVPENLYIIGTMNTADRSLSHLDTALRRRFHFIEMLPQPEVLQNTTIGTVSLTEFLRALNQRMEALLGRDYLIGHAYFMHEGRPVSTPEAFKAVIMNKVLPQLQEYFYDDYEQIQLVLGDEIVTHEKLDLPAKFVEKGMEDQFVYRIQNLEPDDLVAAIAKEYEMTGASAEEKAGE